MIDPDAPLYQHPQENWDADKCKKLSKRIISDGWGTKYHLKGMLHLGELGDPVQGLIAIYNGGCIRENEHWQGEQWQLPKIPKEFSIVRITSLGYKIIEND